MTVKRARSRNLRLNISMTGIAARAGIRGELQLIGDTGRANPGTAGQDDVSAI